MAQIKTDTQLRAKLTQYNYVFTHDEFDQLKKYGFYHVFNSIENNSVRNNGSRKHLSDTLKTFHLDLEIRAILFPIIMEIEGILKQRYVDVIVDELVANSILDPHYNNFVRYCINPVSNLEAKQKLFDSTKHSNIIVEHHFNQHKDIPIWGYLELLTFGNFKKIFELSNLKIIQDFDKKCDFLNSQGLQFSYVSNTSIFQYFYYPISDIRNNLAHNQPVYDIRFKKKNYKDNILTQFIHDLKENYARKNSITFISNRSINYDFTSITDFIILIYLIYINLNEKNKFSDNILGFFNDSVILNNSGLNSKIHSRIFGLNNMLKVNEVISL